MFTGRRWAGIASRSWPASRTDPSVGVSNPASDRSSVVLPQPDGPSSAKNSLSPIVEGDVVERTDAAVRRARRP